MRIELTEALRIRREGRIDITRLLMIGLPAGLFVLWRLLTLGVYDAERVLSAIEEELVDDYRQAVYTEHGLYDDADERAVTAAGTAAAALHDLALRFERVSMAAPLLSFSTREPVVVRFDYVIEAGGVERQRGTGLYRQVSRKGIHQVWDSGPIRYYLNYLF